MIRSNDKKKDVHQRHRPRPALPRILKGLFVTAGLLLWGFSGDGQVVNGVDYSGLKDVYNTFDMSEHGKFGERFAADNLTLTDPVTGVEIRALTTSRRIDSKIYQDHPNWTADGKYIVFRSKRYSSPLDPPDGNGWQYFALSMQDNQIVQVSSGPPFGDLLLGHKKNLAFHFRANQLIALDLGALLADSEKGIVKDSARYESVIATIPDGLRPRGMCLDAADNSLYFSTADRENHSVIYQLNFETGDTRMLVEVPFRTGHFQANPWISGEIMYCWETGGDAPQRIWILRVGKDGSVTNRPGYPEGKHQWVTHEFFVGPDHLLFNLMGHLDRLKKEPTGIVLYNIRTGKSRLLGQAKESGGYWHAAGTKDLKWVVGDTFNGNIYRINTATGEATLLTTGHRGNAKGPFTSEAHAHQSISPDGKWVLFNSSLLSESDIMMVRLQD